MNKRTNPTNRKILPASALRLLFALLTLGLLPWAAPARAQTAFLVAADAGPQAAAGSAQPGEAKTTPKSGDDKGAGKVPPATGDADALKELEQALQRPASASVNLSAPAMAQEVTTVAGEKSSVGRSPAAVFVITNDMIRRSGATSIPEVLRMAPGLDVARVNSSTWAIGSRGFNGELSGVLNDKLLVLIDGRTVYSPVTGGVYWDVQDTLLDDIDRIEVIRGPGATLWGANAVNGVINIITKKAADTQGSLAKLGGGTSDLVGQAAGRYGGKIGDNCCYRVYGKWTDRGQTDTTYDPKLLFPDHNFDQWQQGRAGFRSEWTPDCEDTVTFQGDCYQGQNGTVLSLGGSTPTAPSPGPTGGRYLAEAETVGGNVLGRWTRKFSDDHDFSLQAYYDVADRNDPSTMSILAQDQKVDTGDVDFRDHFKFNPRNNVMWGAGYRVVHDNLTTLFAPRYFTPASDTYNLYTCFVQDEIMLVEDRLYFTIGTKLLHYDLAPFEVQPTARLLWTPDEKHALWAAVSRPVRTPTRLDQDFTYGASSTIPGRPLQVFDPNFQSEDLMAYEIGYREQPEKWFSWDLALFYNDYTNLESIQNIANPYNGNGNRGQGYGIEIYSKLEMNDRWRLSAWYSFLALHVQIPPNSSTDATQNGLQIPGSNPRNQVFLMSSWDVTPKLETDLITRYVDNLPGRADTSAYVTPLPQGVPSYITLDSRTAYRVSRHLELSVVGQNLLAPEHLEFAISKQPRNEIPRGMYGMATMTW